MYWRHVLTSSLALLALACGPQKSSEGASEGAESGESNADSLASESGSESDGATTSADTGESTDTSGDEDSMTFVPIDDVSFGCSVDELSKCDTFAQDCPQGEKCTPILAGGVCLTDQCVQIIGDNTADEACTVVDREDDCDADTWCYAQLLDFDAPAVCVEFCHGSPDEPSCSNPDYVCVRDRQTYESYLGCRPRCNPLEPGPGPCLEGEVCSFDGLGQRDFGCVIASADVPPGGPCDFNQDCGGGLCIEAINLAECAGESCCSSFCDVLAPDCPAGTECELIEVPDNPEATVGVCAIPA